MFEDTEPGFLQDPRRFLSKAGREARAKMEFNKRVPEGFRKTILDPKNDEDVPNAWAEAQKQTDQKIKEKKIKGGENSLEMAANLFPNPWKADKDTKKEILESRADKLFYAVKGLEKSGITEIEQFVRRMYRDQERFSKSLGTLLERRREGDDLRHIGDNWDTLNNGAMVLGNDLQVLDFSTERDSYLEHDETLNPDVRNRYDEIPGMSMDGLDDDQREALAEYQNLSRRFNHLAVEVITENNKKDAKKNSKELNELNGKLRKLVLKIKPWSEEEKKELEDTEIKLNAGIIDMDYEGKVIDKVPEEVPTYAWERPGAVWYEKAHIVDQSAEINSDPPENVGFDLEFYLVPGAGEDTLHWEAVSDDGTRLELPGNFVATLPMKEGVTSEEVHNQVTAILDEKERQGYAYSREDEEGSPVGDDEYIGIRESLHDESRPRLIKRSEIPLSDVRVEDVVPESPAEPEPERWFYKYSKEVTDQTGRISKRDFYFVYEYDENTKKILRYKVNENGQKIANSPKGSVPDAVFTDSPETHINNQSRENDQLAKIAELNKFYMSTNRYSNIEVLNLRPEKNDDKSKKRKKDEKSKKMDILKTSFDWDRKLFPKARFAPAI